MSTASNSGTQTKGGWTRQDVRSALYLILWDETV